MINIKYVFDQHLCVSQVQRQRFVRRVHSVKSNSIFNTWSSMIFICANHTYPAAAAVQCIIVFSRAESETRPLFSGDFVPRGIHRQSVKLNFPVKTW